MISESDLIDAGLSLEEGFSEVSSSECYDGSEEKPIRSLKDRDALICEHLDLAYREAKKRYKSVNHSVIFGDLLSAAYLGLLDAASRFDETKVNTEAKRPFPCYARRRIQGEMNDYLRSCNWGTRNNPRKLTSLDAPADYTWDEAPRPLRDSLRSSIPGPIDELNGIELFEKVIRCLPKAVKEAFRLRFLHDLTMKEIADRQLISESRVSQILSQHRIYLREVHADDRCELWEEALEIRHG